MASSKTPTGTTTAVEFRQQMAGIINGTAKLTPKPNASDNPQATMDQIIFGIDKLPLPKTDVTA